MTWTEVVALEALDQTVLRVLKEAKERSTTGAVVVALHGDLGAGKTTFVQRLGKLLGITEDITSPTFTIMKGYETTDEHFTRLIHMDAYRIDDLTELGPLHIEDVFVTPNTLFCIEWAERIQAALPEGVISLTLSVVDETTRRIVVD